jgi:hypothetical protein
MLAVFVILLLTWIALKVYIARSEQPGPPADGTRISIFVTSDLKGYREPCG